MCFFFVSRSRSPSSLTVPQPPPSPPTIHVRPPPIPHPAPTGLDFNASIRGSSDASAASSAAADAASSGRRVPLRSHRRGRGRRDSRGRAAARGPDGEQGRPRPPGVPAIDTEVAHIGFRTRPPWATAVTCFPCTAAPRWTFRRREGLGRKDASSSSSSSSPKKGGAKPRSLLWVDTMKPRRVGDFPAVPSRPRFQGGTTTVSRHVIENHGCGFAGSPRTRCPPVCGIRTGSSRAGARSRR